jgi:threonine dehydrogenase-like Zn-dependent dehydrogenase
MFFEILSPISDVETIATGRGVREGRRLRKFYVGRRWRKLKGNATVRLASGTICGVELHWYEAHGIGAKDFKIKRILEIQ